MSHFRTTIVVVSLLLLSSSLRLGADDMTEPAAIPLAEQLNPFFRTYCVRCHGGEKPKAELSLAGPLEPAAIQGNFEVWQRVVDALVDRQMPPEEEKQPAESEFETVIGLLEAELAKFDCGGQRHPGRVTIRRLNRAEYNNTIHDLVGIDFQPAADFPSDEVGNGFDNIGDVLSIPPLLLEKYLTAAEEIVARTWQDEAARERIFAVQPTGEINRREAARRNLAAFATRAFRRPVTEEESDRLSDLVRATRDGGYSDEEALQVALQAILASPHFLFRVERDPTDEEDGIRELNDHELATRLSYFLWSTMPDEELFAAAAEGRLTGNGEPGRAEDGEADDDDLREQVSRMLASPKAVALTQNFAGQWLQLRDLKNMTPDPERFPEFDESLRVSMQRETETFFETIIREDRSVLEFLNADFTFLNERLARHYGIAGVTGDELQRVTLTGQRRGVLTQGSILLITSNPTRTSPVKRGKWILENILGDPPPPPPPGVEELQEDGELLGSLRERMEQHRAKESCAVCHRDMDTLGFGLENFDAIGAWRDRDGRAEINAAGTLPGGVEFQGPQELMQILAEKKSADFCRCLTEKMLTYALGRGLQPSDRCAVDAILAELREHDYRFSALVNGIVHSDPFLMRELPTGD